MPKRTKPAHTSRITRPRNQRDGDERQVTQHEDKLGRHDSLEHAIDGSAEYERNKRQQENREAETLHERLVGHRLRQAAQDDGGQRDGRV